MRVELDPKKGVFIGHYKGIYVRCKSRRAALRSMIAILEEHTKTLKVDLAWWDKTYGK